MININIKMKNKEFFESGCLIKMRVYFEKYMDVDKFKCALNDFIIEGSKKYELKDSKE